MKFTYTIELDTDIDSPVAVGEFLRSKFWPVVKDKYGYPSLGCYTTFDWGPEVKSLPDRIEEYNDNFFDGEDNLVKEAWTRGEWNGIICEYFWDGDGMLRFIFPDGTSIFNSDCKKSYTWEWELDPV